MRRRVLIIVLAVVILGAALAGGLYWQWSNSPRYALQQMALALKTRDMNTFFKYLNLKDILVNFLEEANKDINIPEDQSADEWTRFIKNLGRKFARNLLPKLFEVFEPQVRALTEQYLQNLDNAKILTIVAAATVAQIDTQGDEAQVTLLDPKTKEPLRLQMRRHLQSGTWQIVGINYQDMKRIFKREFHG